MILFIYDKDMKYMKKIFSNSIFTFILGAILFSFIGIVSAYSISSNNVDFNPSWTKDNGESITNIDEAIEELYNKNNNIFHIKRKELTFLSYFNA